MKKNICRIQIHALLFILFAHYQPLSHGRTVAKMYKTDRLSILWSNSQSQVQEEGGIRLCLLAAPLVFSKLPCLLGTSTQTDAVLSALGNSLSLWVFTERPTRTTHICASVYNLCTHTHTHIHQTTHWRNIHLCARFVVQFDSCEADIVTPDK